MESLSRDKKVNPAEVRHEDKEWGEVSMMSLCEQSKQPSGSITARNCFTR